MIGVIHISFGGPVHTIRVRNKTWTFEMHRYCGPVLMDSTNTRQLKREPNYVLTEISKWAQQGEKVDELNRCIYDKTIPMKLYGPRKNHP